MSDPRLQTPSPWAAGNIPATSTQGTDGPSTAPSTPAPDAAPPTALGPNPGSQYTGSVQANPYSAAAAGNTFDQTQTAAQQAGLPYVSDQTLKTANAATQGTPARTDLAQTVLDPASTPADKLAKYNQAVEATQWSGVDPMTLAMLALYDGQNQKDKDLSYAQNRLSMYQVMSKKMADYSSYLQGVQRDLDGKTTAEKDDKKKANVEVLCNQQLDFSADSMISLDAKGAYNVKNLAEGKSDKSNMVTAGSLTTRLQLFGQQRDLLQKEIDKWTTTYQNDLQQKNNLAQTVSQLIKDRRDSNMQTIHNI